MEIDFQKTDDILIIKFFGELDHHNSQYVKDKVDLELSTGIFRAIIFDFKGLRFMDSSGIGMILGRYKLITSNGARLFITNMKPGIKRIYEICGLKKIIGCFSSNKEAIESMKGA